ncbi:fructosyl amino acid oxidase [Penicillium samsonianum]|uniref:fructosyl amino acid oxidase n=1 Tax=Penicillium samsonianum TaxID=1882272 RepID=UPI002546A843|nr:fructosyl amino acid oxidase [Penicillium samsonianum]KAJ6137530.1 fructosyl amino acid oxidase [Penicillium samsonianum]
MPVRQAIGKSIVSTGVSGEKDAAGVRKVLYGHSAESIIGFLRCTGVELDDGSHVFADLVILAAGAWTPSVVDLEG